MTDIDPSAVTFVHSAKPNSDEFFRTARDRMRVQQSIAQEWLRFRLDVPERRELVSASLMQRTEAASLGTWTARSMDPATGAFRNLTWNDAQGIAVIAGSAGRDATISGRLNRQQTYDVTADAQDALAAARERLTFRVTTSSGTKQWVDTSSVVLVLTTRPRPQEPTDLAPAGTVGTAKPIFSWSGPAGITKVQVQVDDLTDFATPVYDSGEIVSTSPRIDSATQGPVWAGLSGTMYARARNFTASGWSDWTQVTLTYSAPTVFTVSNPDGADADPSPPSVWTPAAEAFEIISFVDGERVGTTGLVAGPSTSYTPRQSATKKGQVLKRVHRFYDGVARVQPPYSEVVTTTTFTPSTVVAGLSTLSVVQVDALPAVQVFWSRTAGVPDEVGLYRDGDLISQPNGPDGSWYDWHVPPNTDIEYGATAVVNNEHSDVMLTKAVRTSVTGIWLIDAYDDEDDLGNPRGIAIDGTGVEVAYGDVTVVHTPIDGAVLLRRTLTLRGPEGTVSGALGEWPGRTAEQQLDDLAWLRNRPERQMRLVMGDLNIPVVCSSLQAVFDPETSFTHRIRHGVSFAFSHAGGV